MAALKCGHISFLLLDNAVCKCGILIGIIFTIVDTAAFLTKEGAVQHEAHDFDGILCSIGLLDVFFGEQLIKLCNGFLKILTITEYREGRIGNSSGSGKISRAQCFIDKTMQKLSASELWCVAAKTPSKIPTVVEISSDIRLILMEYGIATISESHTGIPV